MNCYIETMSLIGKSLFPEAKYYVWDKVMIPEGIDVKDDIYFLGRQTNETPTKYYIWSLAQKGEMLDKIIVLVTDKCVSKDLPQADNKTTYKYYFDKIKAYLDELCGNSGDGCGHRSEFVRQYIEEKYNGSTQAYLEAIIQQVSVPDSFNIGSWKEILESVSDDDNSEKMNLYFDFTGGSRLASLISLLMLRFVELQNAEVKQVIYSDTLETPYKLRDCTEGYNTLSHIENIAKAVDDNDNMMKLFFNEFEKLGLLEENDEDSSNYFDSLVRASNKTLRKEEREEFIGKINELRESMRSGSEELPVKIGMDIALKKIQSNIEMSSMQKLAKRSAKDLIKDFHEEIIAILFDCGVIIYNGDEKEHMQIKKIRSALKANEMYYFNQWGKEEHKKSGVTVRVREWLTELSNHPEYTPLRTWQNADNVKNRDYFSLMNKRNSVKGFTDCECREFERYLNERRIRTKDIEFWKVQSWQRVYFNYSFPFMCVSPSLQAEFYPEITNYYRDKVYKLFKRLDELREEDRKKYREELDRLLTEPSAVENEIPYMIEMSIWKINADKFDSEADSAAFFKSLNGRIEKVRPYRNAVAHSLDNEFSKPENQEAIAAEIRAWLKEYDERFSQQ